MSGTLARDIRSFFNLYEALYKRLLKSAILRSLRLARKRVGPYEDSSTEYTQLQHRDQLSFDPEHHPPHVRPGPRR